MRVTVATEVHHRVSKAGGGTDDPSNLVALSHDCHLRMDAEEQGKALKPKSRISIDGYPVE